MTLPRGVRCLTVARVSSPDQVAHGYGLEEQAAQLLDYTRRQGLTVLEHLVDEAVTGQLRDRPAIRRIRELVAARVVDVIVFPHIDRLARTAWIGQELLQEWAAAGVRVEFVGHSSPGTPEGNLVVGILGHVAEHEHANIRRRLLQGRRRKALERGVWPARLSRYGYRMVSRAQAEAIPDFAGRDGELLIHEEEAGIVREVFSRFASGESLAALARDFNARGIPSPRGGAWWPSTIARLLAHPAYGGTLHYGRHAYRGYPTGPGGRRVYQVTDLPPEEWATVACPALVTPELAAAVAARLELVTCAPRANSSPPWPLAGVVLCGHCRRQDGRPIHCTSHRKTRNRRSVTYAYRYYRCPWGEARGLPSCGVLVRADYLEALAWETLWEWTAPGALTEHLRTRATAPSPDLGAARAELARAGAALDQDEERVADLIMAGMSERVVSGRIGGIRRRRAELARRGAALLREAEAAARQAEALGSAEETAARIRVELETRDPARLGPLYRRYLRVMLRKGEAPEVALCVV